MYKLTTREQQQYLIIKEYIKGEINRKQAAIKLGVTLETISVLKSKYKKQDGHLAK